jgi:hypothetical protein
MDAQYPLNELPRRIAGFSARDQDRQRVTRNEHHDRLMSEQSSVLDCGLQVFHQKES